MRVREQEGQQQERQGRTGEEVQALPAVRAPHNGQQHAAAAGAAVAAAGAAVAAVAAAVAADPLWAQLPEGQPDDDAVRCCEVRPLLAEW